MVKSRKGFFSFTVSGFSTHGHLALLLGVHGEAKHHDRVYGGEKHGSRTKMRSLPKDSEKQSQS